MDGIIDIIVAVLFIAIPAIFKAIGNKLEKSGSDKAGKFKKIADTFEDFQESDDAEVEDASEEDGNLWDWIKEVRKEIEEEKKTEQIPAEPTPAVQDPFVVSEDVVRQTTVNKRPEHLKPTNRKPIMLIEDESKKGEKIDPKKLVIYSEIMKPKF